MFDYGAENMERYDSKHPPEYNLTLVDVPIVLMSSNRDGLIKALVIYFKLNIFFFQYLIYFCIFSSQ